MNFSKLSKNRAKLAMIIFLTVFFVVNFVNLFGFYEYGWDESVYLHMSDYIKTGGSEGLMENLRPNLFSFLLIPFSDNFFVSRLFVLVLAIATLWVFFLIGKQCLQSKYSWIFPILLAVFPYFFLNSNSVMTEIPALFFHSLSIYFLLKKRHYFSGLFGFLAFLTRFAFGIYLPILLVAIVLRERKSLARFAGGMVTGIPLLLINVFLFFGETKNVFFAAIYPILNQLKDHTMSPYVWLYDKGFMFYPNYLFSWSVFSIFAIIGIIFLLRNLMKNTEKPYSENSWLVYLLIIPMVYLLVSPHKEARYLMLVVPWIVYFLVYGVIWLLRDLEEFLLAKKPKLKKALPVIIIFLVFLSVLPSLLGVFVNNTKPEKEFYTDYLSELDNVGRDKTILTATPMIQTNAQIIAGYNNDKVFYQRLTNQPYDYVYYAAASFPCQENDQSCLSERREIKQYLEENYALYKEGFYFGTDYFIYKK